MSLYLPISDFVWMSIKELEKITVDWIHSVPSDGEHGFIFEVDFANSNDNLSKFSDSPLAPERKSVQRCDLSPYQRRLLKERFRRENVSQKKTQTDAELEEKVNSYSSTEKLIPDLKSKTKYIIHYRTLQLYLQLGLKLTEIRRVLRFRQTAYIEANTIKRQQAINEFEKNFFKLMNNAFFGKTMGNVRKRRLIDIVNTPQNLKKLVAQPTFKSILSFNGDLSAVERIKVQVHMNKPVYIGLCVLDLSKYLMYDFFYNNLRQLFPEVQLLLTDTDSLCVSIEGCDIYKRIYQDTINMNEDSIVKASSLFDFSNYPSNHPCFSKDNKKVPGKM